MLCLSESTYDLISSQEGHRYAYHNDTTITFITIEDMDLVSAQSELYHIMTNHPDKKVVCYVFCYGSEYTGELFDHPLITIKAIPSVLLNAYQTIFKKTQNVLKKNR
jgi:hypothetical protein